MGTRARWLVRDSSGRCQSDAIVCTRDGGITAPSHSPAASPPRCAALSIPVHGEPEHDVDEDEHPQLAHEAAALAIHRVVDPASSEQEAEQAEDRARRAHRRHVATEHEARDRAGRRTREVDQQEPDGSVPALHDGSGEVQGVHVEGEVERAAMEQGHRPEAPVLPSGDRRLVKLERFIQELSFRGQHGRE